MLLLWGVGTRAAKESVCQRDRRVPWGLGHPRLSSVFASKAHCVFAGKRDLKDLWVSAPGRWGAVSSPEAMWFYHPVLVKEL